MIDALETWMKLALLIAPSGKWRVAPNPRVGAVVVKNGELVGQGAHRWYGGPHAEVYALTQAGERSRGATLFITLEPCSTPGKTGACVDRIIAAGIQRVVYGCTDPNPEHKGRGAARLRNAGIEVIEGILAGEGAPLLDGFSRHLESGIPWVVAKWAMTLDGKIATPTGDSRWITSLDSRRRGHRLRRESDGVLVGVGTVLADNPDLTVRLVKGKNPVRIVMDTHLRTPSHFKIVETANKEPTWFLTGESASQEKAEGLMKKGCKVIRVRVCENRVDLVTAFKHLRGIGMDRILLEGGGGLTAEAITRGLVHRVMAFVAPKISGGAEAKTPVEGGGVSSMADALSLTGLTVKQLSGGDLLIQGSVPGTSSKPGSRPYPC